MVKITEILKEILKDLEQGKISSDTEIQILDKPKTKNYV